MGNNNSTNYGSVVTNDNGVANNPNIYNNSNNTTNTNSNSTTNTNSNNTTNTNSNNQFSTKFYVTAGGVGFLGGVLASLLANLIMELF